MCNLWDNYFPKPALIKPHKKVNSAMGLQATTATKRKHELNYETKDATSYSTKTTAATTALVTTNSPPPTKQSRWSINNNSYMESFEEQTKFTSTFSQQSTTSITPTNSTSVNQVNNTNEESLTITTVNNTTSTTATTQTSNNNNNNNNNNNDIKNCSSVCNRMMNCTTNTIIKDKQSIAIVQQNGTNSDSILTINSLVTTLIPQAADLPPTTPLPPISTTPVPEDSIAKLEVVAAVPCEPWTSSTNASEPVDCISKLQAVAVPSDPWGSIGTRSTLATTLLSADELDDDDDDFEDDYEEEETIIPTYCPLRYPAFPSANSSSPASTPHQAGSRLNAYTPTHGYGSRPPNYYSEPFPQQNCSRTGNPQHSRLSNGFSQWHNGSSVNNTHQYYSNSDVVSYPAQPQQTIRCAENGKSYLDLGCSSSVSNLNGPSSPALATPPYASMHVVSSNMDARHPLKRCCDARGTWCNTNKNCYRDIRLKIRNLSMFKLSRFRQVSEQSLYRSVLICNTLKRIDREIESEAKEMHQAAAHAAAQQQQHHQQYQQQLHIPHHLQHHPNHHNQAHPLNPQQLHQQHQLQQQQQQQLQHHEYAPVMSCARLSNIEYNHNHSNQPQQQHQHYQHQHQHLTQQQQQQLFDRMDTPPISSNYLSNSPAQPTTQSPKSSNNLSINHNVANQNNGTICGSSSSTTTTLLHPYDHYPFRETQSGRATPFPNCQTPNTVIPATSNVAPSIQNVQTTVSTQTPAIVSSSSSVSSVSNDATTQTVISSSPSIISSSAASSSTTTNSCDTESSSSSSFGVDDDSTRTINWSSVLSLSSQSALDPLNNNDLFSILPASTSVTNPATATPVPVSTSLQNTSTSSAILTSVESSSSATAVGSAVSISGTFTTVQTMTTSIGNGTNASEDVTSSSSNSSNSSTTATFTTLTTIPATTYSLTSSYVSSMTSSNVNNSSNSPWEYGFLDMDFGLGSEFTELVPTCKLTSEELFAKSLTPVAASRYSSVHDNELEQPAHIMVGS